MTSPFTHRRAERFSQLLDDSRVTHGSDDPPGAADAGLRTLVTLTQRVSDLPLQAEPSPEFRDGLRAFLMATIEREGIGTSACPVTDPDSESPLIAKARQAARRRMRRRTRAFVAVVTSLAAGVIALSGISLASKDTSRGHPLYNVKRTTERAKAAFSGSDTDRGRRLLQFAKTRRDEAEALKGNPTDFSRTLDDMDTETRDGVRLLFGVAVSGQETAALDIVDGFVVEQRRALGILMADLRGHNESRAKASDQLLRDVAVRATAIRATLPCAAAATTGNDSLGPIPPARGCGPGATVHTSPSPGASPQSPGPVTSAVPSASPRSTLPPPTGNAPGTPAPTGTDGPAKAIPPADTGGENPPPG